MPAVKKSMKQVSLILSGEATIVNVEADTLRFSQTLENIGGGQTLKIDASQVLELDTAYLQLVRCLLKSAVNLGIKTTLAGMTESMTQLAGLYGLEWHNAGS